MIRALIVSLMAVATVCALTPVLQLVGSGRWKKIDDEVRVGDPVHVRAGRFDLEKEEPPLSSKRAIALARVALTKIVGDAAPLFECEEVRLCPDWASRNGYWFYVVQFQSDHPSLIWKEEDRTYTATLPFIVYFDGAVELPYTVKPNKSPEQTR